MFPPSSQGGNSPPLGMMFPSPSVGRKFPLSSDNCCFTPLPQLNRSSSTSSTTERVSRKKEAYHLQTPSSYIHSFIILLLFTVAFTVISLTLPVGGAVEYPSDYAFLRRLGGEFSSLLCAASFSHSFPPSSRFTSGISKSPPCVYQPPSGLSLFSPFFFQPYTSSPPSHESRSLKSAALFTLSLASFKAFLHSSPFHLKTTQAKYLRGTNPPLLGSYPHPNFFLQTPLSPPPRFFLQTPLSPPPDQTLFTEGTSYACDSHTSSASGVGFSWNFKQKDKKSILFSTPPKKMKSPPKKSTGKGNQSAKPQFRPRGYRRKNPEKQKNLKDSRKILYKKEPEPDTKKKPPKPLPPVPHLDILLKEAKVEREPLKIPGAADVDLQVSSGIRRPRLTLKKTNNHVYATIVDDLKQHTLCFAATTTAELGILLPKVWRYKSLRPRNHGGTVKAAFEVGKVIGRKALRKGIPKVVFDRGNYRYHGKVKALAEGARAVGLDF